MVGQGGDAAGLGRRRHLVARCAGRCGRQSAGHRVTEERADAAGARRRLRRRASRGHRTGQPGAVVCQSRRGGFLQQPAAETAGGDRAGAGATDQPRSKSRRRRHQDRVPEIRNFPRGVAGGRLSPRQRRSRSQGRADRASPDAAVGAWQQRDSRDAGGTGGAQQAAPPQAAAASLAPSSSPNLDVQEILLPQARLRGRRKPRAGRPGRPQSACGGARRRTFGRCDLEPAAGSAAGAWQPGARQPPRRKTLAART